MLVELKIKNSIKRVYFHSYVLKIFIKARLVLNKQNNSKSLEIQKLEKKIHV